MGRIPWSDRPVLEKCRSITIKWLKANGYFKGIVNGSLRWATADGQDMGAVSLRVVTLPSSDEHDVRLSYTLTKTSTGVKESFEYSAPLVWSPCHFGGRRWWFTCPMKKIGSTCRKRVGALYLFGNQFGCRKCHNLTYLSSRNHNPLTSYYNKIFKHDV